MKQKYDFICEICGRHDYVSSELRMELNYGSRFDGERLELSMCGDCADMILAFINLRGLRAEQKEG